MTDTRPRISLRTVVLDTDDPPRMAEFYSALLGWTETSRDVDWITLTDDAGNRLAFQLAINHRAPTWPDNTIPQQVHLDLTVDDIAAAGEYAVSLGARPVKGPDADPDFAVFLDPSGHPFCLCI